MPSTRRAPAPPKTGPAAPPDAAPSASRAVRTLKKYPNRRLYDTEASSYITLADVKRMVLAGDQFEVRDAKTGDDLTRSILLQIILEEESGGVPMFSTPVLAQIIRFYGNAMQGMLGALLEKNLQSFFEMQARFADQARLYDPSKLTPEVWTSMLSGQTPAMRNLLGDYLDELNQQLAKAGGVFPGFPGTKR
jgi:polyhydroxyalkanoate synthesis repressor PhaR